MEYTRRSLTRCSDLLYALSGVAERMYMYIKAPYLAGFWGDRFLETLVWTISTSDPSTSLHPLPKEDPIPGMPTWSFFSLDQPINFAVMDTPGAYNWACKFLSSDFLPYHHLSREDFSRLRGRKIVLEGPTLEVKLVIPKLWKAFIKYPNVGSLSADDYMAVLLADAPLVEDAVVDGAGQPIPTVRRVREGDKPESSTGYHTVLALYIGSWKPAEGIRSLEGLDHHFVLILARSSSVAGAYERLGMTDSRLFVRARALEKFRVRRIEVV